MRPRILTTASQRPPDAPSPPKLSYVEGHLLVRFRAGLPPTAAASAHAATGGRVVTEYRTVGNLQRIALPPGMPVSAAVQLYRRNRDVLYAEPDYVVRTAAVPNDPQFGDLWALLNTGQEGGLPDADIDATEAWGLSTGSRSVVVAVIDTGIDYTHPDLSANMWRNTTDCNTNGFDDDGNGYIDDCHGIDTFNGDSDPMDDNGHGTHVAGIIGAVGNNGVGVVGVNWQVSLLACKFLGPDGSGAVSSAISCLEYVALMQNRGINIVVTNNSWGLGVETFSLRDAINTQRQRGILFVAAAGNFAMDNDFSPFYPANYFVPNVVSVGASTRRDALGSFSHIGRRTVHLLAPGEDIWSTIPVFFAGPDYFEASGTSMAAPHVAGTAALLKAQDPTRDWLAIRNLLLAGGDLTPGARDSVTRRRLNTYGAMTCGSSVVRARLRPTMDFLVVGPGEPVDLAVLHINCTVPNGRLQALVNPGSVFVTLNDDGVNADQLAGDGVYSARWIPPAKGFYTITLPGDDVLAVSVDPAAYFRVPDPFPQLQPASISLNLSDDSVAEVTSPFPIAFAGGSFTKLYVSSNGTVSFTGPFFGPENAPIPSGEVFAGTLLAPFWDDLRPLPGTAKNVFVGFNGTAPNRQLVIDWRNIGCYEDPNNSGVRFQVVFYENSGAFQFKYGQVTFDNPPFTCNFHNWGHAATVGVQWSPTLGFLVGFNTSVLSPGQTTWTIPPAVLSVVPATHDFGPVPLGGIGEGTFTIQNTGDSPLVGTVTTSSPFSIVSDNSFALPYMTSQVVTVRFNPTVLGGAAGTLEVSSNAGSASRALTGTGITGVSYALTVTKDGSGTGTVTSVPAGINCGGTCVATFAEGVPITITPSPGSGSGFAGWTAPCSGMGACTFVISSNTTVNATFALQTFADVPPSDWGYGWIHQLYSRGITAGCAVAPQRYCPDGRVTRREMAVFLIRAMGETPATCTGMFSDVPVGDWGCGWIEKLATLGITAGCGSAPLRYCPDNNVSRREMAVFLNRAAGQTACPTCGQSFFDVPPWDWGYGWVERLYQRRITSGCSTAPLRYCPDNFVTRREMAVFLIRNFWP